MRRSIAAFFTVFLAALLSVVLAVPANAAPWVPPEPKNTPARYHWGFDYFKPLTQGPSGGASSQLPRAPLPVSPTVHPSVTGPASSGPSYYLNQAKTRALNPANIPLEGKIIQPDRTVVRTWSSYGPVVKFAPPPGLGWGRLLGSVGVGIGGVSEPPENWKQIAAGQGIPSTCVENVKNCTPEQTRAVVNITSCGLNGNCAAIGATGAGGEADLSKWFKNDALPFLEGLWANLTGQKGGSIAPADTHQNVYPRGCFRDIGIEHRGGNSITLHYGGEITSPRPPAGGVERDWWDYHCAPAVMAGSWVPGMNVQTVCKDSKGMTKDPDGNSYSKTLASDNFDPATGFNTVGLCGAEWLGGENYIASVLFQVRVINVDTQAFYDASPSSYSAVRYSQWVNPNPEANTIENTKITTAWDCRDTAGQIYTYTKSVTKIAAAVAPDCPVGTDLVKHNIKADDGAGTVTTIDAGAEKPGTMAQFPECSGAGCTLSVHVDGVPCTVSRSECQTWPAVAAVTPSRVVCKWGSYNVPTSDCYGIANGYKSETGTVFDPKAGTWVAIDTHGNPVAPNPEPWNPTNPNPTPGTTPGTATPPATGGFPVTGTNPATSPSCDAPGWSWNPVEWVKNPVVCALADAFVPKTDITARMTTIQTIAVDKPPMNWLFPPPMVGPAAAGCPNWNIKVAGLTQNVVCDSSFTAALVGVRAPMFGLIAAAMVWPLMRGIWYAAIPILRVTPTSSK
jgi:hypothetical protein